MAEGRIAELAPARHLAGEELLDGVACREGDGPGVRLVGLDEHPAGRVTAAAARELRHELEGALLGAEVGEGHGGVRIHDSGQRDALEVVALGDHLRAQEDAPLAGREAAERLGERSGPRGDVRVEAETLQLRDARGELLLELLGACAEPGDLGGAAGGADLGRRLAPPAVVAVEETVAVQRQRDVAGLAAQREPAGPAVERRRHAAAVQEQDGLAAAVGDRPQLGQERRRERVTGLAPQVDDPYRRQRPGQAPAELEPLEPLPALRARRRAPVDGDGTFERRALRGHGARVVARVGLLLVGRVVLLVHAEDPKPRDGREDRRARADDDGRRARGDALSLVPPLGVGERASGAPRPARRSGRGSGRAPAG